MRGNRRGEHDYIARQRSIPACAGEPGRALREPVPDWVYPRVCGGTSKSVDVSKRARGLSPRVRGNRHARRSPVYRRRSIPACAGEPTWSGKRRIGIWVYPRVCGGTKEWGCPIVWGTGLSPRVRGNQSWINPPDRPAGSIPACAGEPRQAVTGSKAETVYPRVCGGTRQRRSCRSGEKGLSPRVRGNLDRKDVPARPIGSIPACAGEPC